MAAKIVLAIAVVVAVISTAAADTSRTHPNQEQCPKQGLCPFVRQLVTDVHAVHPVTAVLPSHPIEHPVHPVYPVHPGVPLHSGAHGPSVAHPVPAVFFYPHHIHRRDTPHTHASLCGNLCTHDHQCPGTKKCCATECGFSCFDPVHIAY